MVRRDEVDRVSSAARCSSPAGGRPVSVSAGAPRSRRPASAERPMAQAECRKPLRRTPARGPQPDVPPAASTDLPSESRAGQVAAKALSARPPSGGARVAGLGGVWGAARVQGEEGNTRGPSARPRSGPSASSQPTANSSRAPRESEGVVVPAITATQHAVGGKGRCCGRARTAGPCQGRAGRTGPHSPDARQRGVTAQPPRHARGPSAQRRVTARVRSRRDRREAFRAVAVRAAHAASRRPSVSRVPDIGMHGLKGGPALSPMTITV